MYENIIKRKREILSLFSTIKDKEELKKEFWELASNQKILARAIISNLNDYNFGNYVEVNNIIYGICKGQLLVINKEIIEKLK